MTQRQQVSDKNVEYVENYLDREQLKDERSIARVALLIGKHVNDGPLKRNVAKSRQARRDTHLFDAAVERAVEHGYITVVIQGDGPELQRGPNPVVA
jgi:hypothetical protein